MIVCGVVNYSVNSQLLNGSQSSYDYYTSAELVNVNNSVGMLVASNIASDPNYRVSTPVTISLFGFTATYSSQMVYIDPDSIIQVSITSTNGQITRTSTIYFYKNAIEGVVPSTVKASVTSRANLATLGSMIIDGNDHTTNGDLISPSSGTYGLWTTGTVNQSGGSTIGGFSNGVSTAPRTNNTVNIMAGQPVTTAPSTPDLAMGGASAGYSEGKLKEIALSGVGGSQYVVNPGMLNYPLSGVTYVELAYGDAWTSSNISGSGVLIVHNAWTNARMINLNSGTFKGMMIIDDLVHLHTDIIGGVIVLTNAPSEGNCIGNGNGTILYSSSAIKSATQTVMEDGNIPGNRKVNYGFGNTRSFVKYWLE